MNVSLLTKMDYGKKTAFYRKKTKPKQSQTKPIYPQRKAGGMGAKQCFIFGRLIGYISKLTGDIRIISNKNQKIRAVAMVTDENSIRHKFKKLWMYYIWQSALASIALFIIILILDKDKMVVISAMGATAFTVFAMPKAVSAQTRNVIGGHLVGLAIGSLFYYANMPYYAKYPLVVGIAVFVMVALDFEHPPAAGTTLAVVMNEVSWDVFVTIMISALVLSQCRYYLRHYLKDLV